MKSITTNTESVQKAATLTIDQALQQAIAHHKAGQLQEAERLYRAILQAQPNHPDANHNLGVLAVQVKQPAAGLPHFKTALEANPNQAQYWFSYIDALIQTDQADVARLALAQAQERGMKGETVDALVRRLSGGPQATEQSYVERQKTANDLPPAAVAPQESKKQPKPKHRTLAKSAGKVAPKRREPSPQEVNALAILFNQGRYTEMETLARAMTVRFPKHGVGWKALGAVLQRQGRNTDAMESMQKAAELLLSDAEAHFNLGVVLLEQGRLAEAEVSYRRALEIRPNYAVAHSNLGAALQEQGRLAEAEASYRRVLELKPDFAEARSNLLFALNYSASHPSSYCLEAARRFGRMAAKKATGRFSFWQCAAKPERLRVGLVSGDLRSHPVGYFLEGLLAHIDPARVELLAYPTHPKADELTARIRPRFAAWKPLMGQSDEAAARMIHADGLHVLLDLAGHTAHNRLPVFAWKPAPVQASWLGYFATTGVTEMDYVLADEVGVPDAHRQQFTETIWYLPDTRLCFTAPKVDLPIAPLLALAKGSLTFGCFQNIAKVGDEVLARWGTILGALPAAQLRVQCKQFRDPAVGKRLVQRLQQHGIDPNRVTMHGPIPWGAYLAAHAEVDVILDTFPFPGGTTTCEALWMGVPTLTLAGDSLLSRQGASLLTAAELPEWVAASEAEYVDKAIALARDLPKLAALRAALRPQVLASPLFDAPRFARNFEAALWGMWQHWQGDSNMTSLPTSQD